MALSELDKRVRDIFKLNGHNAFIMNEEQYNKKFPVFQIERYAESYQDADGQVKSTGEMKYYVFYFETEMADDLKVVRDGLDVAIDLLKSYGIGGRVRAAGTSGTVTRYAYELEIR